MRTWRWRRVKEIKTLKIRDPGCNDWSSSVHFDGGPYCKADCEDLLVWVYPRQRTRKQIMIDDRRSLFYSSFFKSNGYGLWQHLLVKQSTLNGEITEKASNWPLVFVCVSSWLILNILVELSFTSHTVLSPADKQVHVGWRAWKPVVPSWHFIFVSLGFVPEKKR